MANRTHGHARDTHETTLYSAWLNMKARCKYRNLPAYKDYGGRGITVCERWLVFENFLADMGEKPGPEYTLERINNDLGYGPDNCKWATRVEQANNRRNVVRVEWRGKMMTVTELADECGVNRDTLYDRIFMRGWDVERAVVPPNPSARRNTRLAERMMG